VHDPDWRSRKIVKELFFLLLAHPEGLTKEAAGGILWPDSSPAQLRLRFKNAIYRVRRALGQEVVLLEENLYRFNRAMDYEYDVESFLRGLAQAQAVSAPPRKAAAYREALDLYQGPYLPEADGTWVWAERERLWRACAEALLQLARLSVEAEEHKIALKYCHRALSQDPCLEEAHRLAMRAWAALGNRVAVHRQFERCRQALLEEANASPSPQTDTLYETLMR
jgi:two-component SAPR family response regulator